MFYKLKRFFKIKNSTTPEFFRIIINILKLILDKLKLTKGHIYIYIKLTKDINFLKPQILVLVQLRFEGSRHNCKE